MIAIDELNRLHEAATKGPWRDVSTAILPHSSEWWAERVRDAHAIVALHNAWPAIHRVLVAARSVDKATTPTALEAELWNLGHELRALDGHQG